MSLLGSIQSRSPLARITERLVQTGKFEVMDRAWESSWQLATLEPAPWTDSIDGAIAPADVDLDDEVLVVNLWASWCPPCRNELPSMMKLAQSLRNKKVRFVFITYDEGWDAPQKLLAELFGGMPRGVVHARDPLGSAGSDQHPDSYWKRLGATALPETFFVRRGKVLGKIIGEINWEHPDIKEYISLVVDS
ncbi:MAG: thiol-disulfide isomerase/thioredoxin [Myxococcota bacterium]|jgi:thiol-disulfide isomerase/thioredoxin